MATQTKSRTAGTRRSRASTSRGTTPKRGTGRGAARFAIPVASAAVGVIGGVILDRRGLRRRRRFDALSKQIGEAGKQLGKLANEVRTAREKAEEVGKAIS